MIIDIGCGGTVEMPFQTHGTIKADVYLDLKKPIFKLQNFIQADINHLPFPNESFDKVFCHHVLEHLEDPIKAIKELLRITKDLLEIKVPHRFWVIRDPNPHKHHFSRKYFTIVFKNFDARVTITHYRPLIPFLFVSPQEIMIRVSKNKFRS